MTMCLYYWHLTYYFLQISMNVLLIRVDVNRSVQITMEVLCVHAFLVMWVVYSVQVLPIFKGLWLLFYSDINECDLGISGCNQTCINTVGSYYCGCQNGYYLSSDNHTCIGLSLNLHHEFLMKCRCQWMLWWY